MPCTGSCHSVADTHAEDLKARDDMLCSACRALVRMGYDMEENPRLSEWWAAHLKADREREAEEARQEVRRKSALHIAANKSIKDLTPNDKRLLREFDLLS